LGILSIPSIFIGYYTKDMVIGLGTDFWGTSIFVLPERMTTVDSEFINHTFKILPVVLSLIGSFAAFLIYTLNNFALYKLKVSYLGKKFYNFFNKKWFFDKFYNEYLSQLVFDLGYSISYKTIDRGIFEILGPMGLSSIIVRKAKSLQRLQTGYIYHYAFLILVATTIFLGLRECWFVFGCFIDYRTFLLFSIAVFFMEK